MEWGPLKHIWLIIRWFKFVINWKSGAETSPLAHDLIDHFNILLVLNKLDVLDVFHDQLSRVN